MIAAVIGAPFAAGLEIAVGVPDCATETASAAFFLGVIIAGQLDDLRSYHGT